MKTKNLGIVVFLVAIAFMMGPASAAVIPVGPNDNIQSKIDSANSGDTLNFTDSSSVYNGVSLTINKALNMVGNGATLVGSGSAIMTITGTTGLKINGFNININSNSASGITGSSVVSCNITNNTITNGGDAINIFQMYKDLTINNNTITTMTNKHGDAISIVNHDSNVETTTTSRVTNNVINHNLYGIFVGGNFNGTISGNNINDSQTAAMNITGKHNASLGSLNADITGNTITNAAIGISMENPNVIYLDLEGNTVSSSSASLLKGYYFRGSNGDITNTGNTHNNAWDLLNSNGGYWP